MRHLASLIALGYRRVPMSHTLVAPHQEKARQELAAIRRALGLTVAAFAERLGCTRASIARWEAGTSPVPQMALLLAWSVAEHPERLPGWIEVQPAPSCEWEDASCTGDVRRYAVSLT